MSQQYPHGQNQPQPYQPPSGAPGQPPGNPQTQPPKKKHTLRNVLLGAGAVLVVILGAAGVGGAGDEQPTPGAASTPVSAPTPADNGPTPDPITTPTNEPPATEGTGCDINSSPEEYADCLDEFVKGTTAPPKPTKTAPKLTASQEQAIGAAEDYLSYTAFSRKGLIQQLSSKYGSGFSKADATYAVDHIKVNWNEQAAKAAKNYLEMSHFSRAGLIQQLESKYGSQFTHAQAVYGVNKAGL